MVCWVGILWNCENWTESCSSCLLLNRKQVLLSAAFLQSSSSFKRVSFTVKGRHRIQTKSTAYDEKGSQRSHTLTDDWLLCVNFHPDLFITLTVLWECIYNSIPIKPSELNWQNNNSSLNQTFQHFAVPVLLQATSSEGKCVCMVTHASVFRQDC